MAGFDATLEVRTGGSGVAELIAAASEAADADVIVLGTHGRGGFTASLMGSVARALCHTAGRPVLVVPPPRATRRHTPSEQQPTAV